MDRPASLPLRRKSAGVDETAEGSRQVISVRPVRAAFGPVVSVMSRDEEGRLWIRFSAAFGLFLASIALMLIPLSALWWVTDGLADSGQVSFDNPPVPTAPSSPNTGGAGVGTELPRADQPQSRS